MPKFARATASETLRAIKFEKSWSEKEKRAFSFAVTGEGEAGWRVDKADKVVCDDEGGDRWAWARLPKPARGDWLTEHREAQQTLARYSRVSMRAQPHGHVKVVQVVPIGDPLAPGWPELAQLARLAGAFFGGCEVRVAAPIREDRFAKGERVGAEGQRQLYAPEILDFISSRELDKPRDVLATVAVTMVDLYPDPEWNFVFGLARMMDGAAVYSFCRYQPDGLEGGSPGEELRHQMNLRAAKVFCHETGHLFGLTHCVYFNCLMQGSNHLEESDAKPLYLCPVCLRKLQSNCKFDVAERYAALEAAASESGFKSEAAWFARRAAFVRGGAAAVASLDRVAADSGGAAGGAGAA